MLVTVIWVAMFSYYAKLALIYFINHFWVILYSDVHMNTHIYGYQQPLHFVAFKFFILRMVFN